MPSLAVDLVAQPTAACPKCGSPVPLTEALVALLLEATRAEYENKLRVQKDGFQRQQQELGRRERAAEEARQQLERREAELKRKADEARAEIGTHRAQLAAEVTRQTEAAVTKQLAERLAVERKLIIEAEERRTAQRFADELAERDRDRQEQAEHIERLQAKLTASLTAEAELKRCEQEFQDRERELPLRIEHEVSGRLDQVRATAASEAEQRLVGVRVLTFDEVFRRIESLVALLETSQ